MTERKTIWCLFSVANDYDQPGNTLAAWWTSKPDIPTLASAMHISWAEASDEDVIATVRVHEGAEGRSSSDGTHHKLALMPEGELDMNTF